MFLQIAVNCPLRRVFDYLPPADLGGLELKTLIGARLSVPFGKRELIGICTGLSPTSAFPADKLKAATAVIDQQPLMPENLLSLFKKISAYYHHPLGEVVLSGLPADLRKGKIYDEVEVLTAIPDPFCPSNNPHQLNQEQQHAVETVADFLTNPRYGCFLLNGITGSGKTEVYLQLLTNVLLQKRQAIVLIPEIALTPQTLARFSNRFGEKVYLYHSARTEKQKREVWLKARSQFPGIYIGTRSALFLPCQNLSLIIIDEEHDSAFKQQDGFKYHARDVAVLRAYQESCPILLGSATPSFETLANVEKKAYQELTLSTRAGNAALAPIQLIDVRHNKLEGGLSAQLIHALRPPLEKGEQVLLFLNRRGFAPILMCFDCGHMIECRRCDAKMTYHAALNKCICHHCQATITVPKLCPSCQGTQMQPLGAGTQRIESVLQEHLGQIPGVEIIRIDSDATKKKGALETKLDIIHQPGPKVLIGTQMLAKGHHFPEVTLVAIVDVDQGLFSPDFKATERMAQTIIQVAGRAGRATKQGKVLLQTFHPTHPFFSLLIQEGYGAFAQSQLRERQSAMLPPYKHLSIFRAESTQAKAPFDFLETLAQLIQKAKSQLPQLQTLECFGPISAPMEKRSGRYRAQLILSCTSRKDLHGQINNLMAYIDKNKLGSKLHWTLDVDPIDTY